MDEIIRRLEQRYGERSDHWICDPFQVLVATILSQNTSDRNSHRAFLRLMETVEVKPEVLSRLKSEDIKSTIRSAGLSNIKSRRIIEVSKEVLARFNGDLSEVFLLSLKDAREALMVIKGIGPKTADVLLSFVGGYPVMPVDTNIFRVVDRLGFAKGRNYERTRSALERLISSERLKNAHVNLIHLGREKCKPRKPQCQTCPVNTLCDYSIESIKKFGGK